VPSPPSLFPPTTPILPTPSYHPSLILPHTCLHVVASASYSPSRPKLSYRLSALILTSMSFILTRPVKYLTPMSTCHPTLLIHYSSYRSILTFHSIRAYSARMSFYRLKQFQCEVTGKSGLDYFQAVESERHEARTLHSRFSEPLKPAVLKAVQWRASCPSSLTVTPVSLFIIPEVMGRLDHLVEAVYDRFKDRYFVGESMLPYFSSFFVLIKSLEIVVDISGTK
jgi:hypothetical protein